ncbi:hypothetical protein Droror1_Dr00025274 [Drosera rotundifolia]
MCSFRLPIDIDCKVCQQNQSRSVCWRLIWSKEISPKHGFMLWLSFKGKLRVKSWMFKHGICSGDVCLLCQMAVESVKHIDFFFLLPIFNGGAEVDCALAETEQWDLDSTAFTKENLLDGVDQLGSHGNDTPA